MGNMAQIHRIPLIPRYGLADERVWRHTIRAYIHIGMYIVYIYVYRYIAAAAQHWNSLVRDLSWISRFGILLTTIFNYTKTADVFYLNKLNLFLLHCHGIYYFLFFLFFFFFFICPFFWCAAAFHHQRDARWLHFIAWLDVWCILRSRNLTRLVRSTG